jgi:transcriptional regulator with XRE-family HTH domain
VSNHAGQRVRALRIARGVAQSDLAARIGVSKSYLSHIEAGRRAVSPAMVQDLAEALGVDVEQLQSGTPTGAHEDLSLRLAFAELSLRNGDRELAAEEFAKVLADAQKLPFERFADEATWGLARAQEALGKLEEAIVSYEELMARPELSPGVPPASVAVRLVMAYSECGDLSRAVDIGEDALEDLDEMDPPPDVSDAVELISSVAGCYLERGDLTRAQMLIDRALVRSGEDGSPRARAAAAWNAAVIAQARHDAVGARRQAERALALYAEMDNARGVAMLRVVSAALRLRDIQPDAAAALLELDRALTELHDVGTRVDLGYARTEQARAMLLLGDLTGARQAAHRALDELPSGDRYVTGYTLLVLGHVAAAQGDPEEAVTRLRAAAAALEHTDASRQTGIAWRELGEAYVALGRPEEAIGALRRASDLAGATYNPLRPQVAADGSAAARNPVG